MTQKSDWHCPRQQLVEYEDGRLGDMFAWSVERHLVACVRCRRTLGEVSADRGADTALLAAVHDRILGAVGPYPPPRLARATRWRQARIILGGTSGPRAAWFIAVLGALLIAVALEAASVVEGSAIPVLLLVAPLLPVLGIALSYGRGVDPTYEMAAATPVGGLRLLLWRAVAVLGVTIPASALAIGWANLLASRPLTAGLAPLGWLLPSISLSIVVVGLSSFVRPTAAAVVVGLAWVGGVAAPVALTSEVLLWQQEHGVVILCSTAVAAGLVVLLRRAAYSVPYLNGRTQ